MAKTRESSTEKNIMDIGSEFSGGGIEKKPNWVTLAQLDGPMDDSLANRLLYKPALRFHGNAGGLWGQGLSEAPSMTSDPPPSYRFAESMASRQPGGDACSTCDVDTLYNTANITAQSPLTLRRRNTVAVILVAIALLAAVAAVTGVILHFLHPKAMLRANVRFTIANRNYTEDMGNQSSIDFHDVARPLCQEMDVYFLTSELADFYLGCNVVSMRKDTSRAKNGTEVHYTLDFIENKVSNDAERIKKIIMRKSGRHKTEDTLYLTVRDFLVYLRSLRVGLEVLPLPDDHPGRKHRPRIPWNDDIDFISRKSDGANSSSVNESVLIDKKQLTNNLTEKQERKTVNMSIDIPTHILPGGEIKELPILAPTPFHPSATPYQHAHALYLSSIAEQMPLLSHMFQNISVSLSINVYNNQSVIHGVGAFINPSRASVYVSDSESKHIRHADRVPTVQELNIKNGIIAQKLMPPNYDRESKHSHDTKADQIEASFHDITDTFDNNIKATEVLEKENTHGEKMTSDEINQKIFTIFTDVFLILGSNSETMETFAATSTPPLMLDSSVEIPTQLNEFVEDNIYVEKKTRTSVSSKADTLPREFHLDNVPPLLMMATVSVDINLTEAPKLIAKPIPLFDAHNRIDKSLSGSMANSLTKSVLINDNMQMKEMMVDLPTQEAAVPIKENIKWKNIFNIPQRTVNVHVGNIRNNSGMIPVSNKMFKTPLQNDNKAAVEVTNLNKGTYIQREATFVSQDVIPDADWGNLQQNKIGNTVNNYPQLPLNKNILTTNNDGSQSRLQSDAHGIQEMNIPQFVNDNSNRIPIKRNGYYWPLDNTWVKPTFRNTDVSGNNLLNTFRNNKFSNIFSREDVSTFPHPAGQIAGADNTDKTFNKTVLKPGKRNQNINWHMNSTLKDIRSFGNSGFPPRNSNFSKGRRTVVVTRPNKSGQPNTRNIRRNINQQPWFFLNQLGVDLALFDRNSIVKSRGHRRNGPIVRDFRPPHQTQQGQRPLNSRNRNSMTGSGNPRGSWRNTNVIGSQFQMSRLLQIDRNSFNPALPMRLNWGLPKSPDFSDIADMKEILKQLVNSMYNMTAKIDNMQDAINFINKTFHETHRPLFNLEETLGNMTVSLGNLNQNLNSINATMNAFKDFLKQFGNTVFNIDDVIKHIDETIGNLGNAVSYIENSMTDLNGTVNGIADNVVDIDKTLTHVNRSVLDVNSTAAYSNQTLDSMKDTLISLENAVNGLALKVHVVTDDADVLDISLKNINDTVKNTHNKLNRLHSKMLNLNSSMIGVETQMHRLNDSYNKINKTLQNMNEPYMFINGTVLEVIQKLSNMDEQLVDLNKIMDVVKTNITVMNMSLLESIDWMEEMVQTLTDFSLWVGNDNNTIKISLRNKNMIETVGMLIDMNGTLSDIGHKVDDINVRLDNVDQKLQYLEDQLLNLDRTLDNIDVKFKMLDKTLDTINVTVKDTKSSLDAINSTVQAMDSTFDKMDVSFGNINETLDSVNRTLMMINSTGKEINSTINDVEKTFTDLVDTINETTQSAQKLTHTVSEFTGSVSELNSQLYNANESLRITKSKADIASKSYGLLNNTLDGVDKTLSELRTKLSETNVTLQHTNTSLTHVNDSLQGIQNSFQSLRTELSDVQNSFIKMKTSMKGFGTAFPNIQNSIQEAQRRMSQLQLEISEIDNELHNHKTTRDDLVKKHGHLQNSLKSVSDMLDTIQLQNVQMKNLSWHIDKTVGVLNDSVHKAIDIYNKTEINIKYINETHDQLKNKYEALQKHSDTTNTSLGIVKQDLDLLRNNFKELKNELTNYSNIDVQIDLMISSIVNEVLKYENVNEKFQNWTEKFRFIDEIVWDNDGNPSGVYDTFKTLVNKTEFMNKTSDDYGLVLNDTDKAVKDMAKFNDVMHKQLMGIYNIRNKIDVIDKAEANLNNEIADTDESIKAKHANLTELLGTLNGKLVNLQNLRDTYGNINGSFNSVDSLETLENKIKSTIRALQNEIAFINNASDDFQKAVGAYKMANDTYQNNIFDLGRDSDNILNDTLLVMEDTKLRIDDTNTKLDGITNFLDKIDNEIKHVDDQLNELEDTLVNQKNKNNYVTANRSKMEKQFIMAFEKFNETYSMQNELLNILNELKNRTKEIDEHISGIPNINISTLPEKTMINQLMTKVSKFDEELFKVNHYLETFYDRFVQFEESNNTLPDVKKEYGKYRHAIEHFRAAVKNISSEQSTMFEKTRNMSETFDYLLRQLNEFQGLEIPIVKANVSLQFLKSNLNRTASNITRAADELVWLKDEFDKIKHNYTNFTATEIDLTESYVMEAINEIDDHIFNITSELELANISVAGIQNMFDDTENIYKEKIYDRKNIESTIQDILYPNLKEISEQTNKTNKDLDKINSVIRKIDLSLKGVNETIHTTNKQLFIDRQKELLADTRFPDLEHSIEFANESLKASSDNLNKTRNSLEDTINVFENLKERLEMYPSVNISLDDFGAKLKSYNDTLETMYKRLNENFELLNNVNETIWLEDGKRYLNNETIQDMKTRYKSAEDMLGNILNDITDINSITELVKNGTSDVNKELSLLNISLHDLDGANTMLKNAFQGLSPLDEDVNEIRIKVQKLEHNFSNVDETFNKLKVRFSNINESIYNYHVLPFHDEELQVNYSINILRNGTESVLNDLEKTHELFDSMELISNDTYDSMTALTNIINLKKNISKDITQTIDDVTTRLRDIRKNVSIVEPDIQQLDSRLTEMKNEFSLQEKTEYFESKFPTLNAKAELVKKSLLNSSGYLDKSQDQFESVRQTAKDLEARLVMYPSVNISLADITANLQFSNDSLYNLSKRLSQNLDSLSKANQSLWTDSGENFSDKELIDEMKTRFERAEEVFDNLLTDVVEIDNISSTVNKMSASAANDINGLSDSLNNFDEAKHLTDQLFQELFHMESLFSEFQNEISELEHNVSTINKTFGDIQSKYLHINSSIFNEYTTPFHVDISSIFTDVDFLSVDVNNSSENLTQANTLLELAKVLRHKTLMSHLDLESVINNNTAVNTNVTELLREVKLVVPDIKRSISDSRKQIHNLKVRLREMENVFRQQEKVDYSDEYFPRKKYDSLNNTIVDVKKRNDQLKSNLSAVAQSFTDLQLIVDKHENINFDTSAVGKSLTFTDTIVVDNSQSLKNISEDYLELEQMLYADDGSVISDMEAIDEMKKRYEVIDKRMDKMNAELENMKHSIRKRNISIDENVNTINEMQSLVDSYGKIREDVNELERNNKKINKTVDALIDLNSDRAKVFRNEIDLYETIKSSFNGTTSDSIQQLKQKISNSMNSLEGDISQLDEYGINLHDNVSLLEELTKNYTNGFLASHVHTEPLRGILLDFPKVNDTVSNIAHFVSKASENVNQSGTAIDNELDELKKDINKLRQLLVEQEKQDYIRKNAPKLLHLLGKTKKEINRTKLEIQDLNTSSNSFKDLYEAVQIVTANESSLEISLIPNSDVIQLVDKTIPRFEDSWDEGYNLITSIDVAILDDSGTYFNKSNTIEDIKDTFEMLNRSLQNIGKNLSDFLHEKDVLLKAINKEIIFLTNLSEEAQTLQKLKSEHLDLKEGIHNLDNDLVETKFKSELLANQIEYLEKSLDDVDRIYGDVKEPSLHHDVGLLRDDIRNLKDKHRTLKSLLNDTRDNYNSTSNKSKLLENILINVSRTLEELQTKTLTARPVNLEIGSDLIVSNSSIHNISDSIEESLNTIPKTNKSITDLRERFRRQQIYEYIKENFPTLLEEYAAVNRTLNSLDIRIPDVSSHLQVFNSNNSALDEKLGDLGLFKIPINDTLAVHTKQNETFSNVLRDKMRLENIFNDFQDVISNNFDSNETLSDIKTRFSGYETTLHDMNEKLKGLHSTLDGIDTEISKALNTTSMYNEALDKYENVLKTAEVEDQAVKALGNLTNNTNNDLELIENTIELQKTRLADIGERFKNVNSSVLHAKKISIEQNLKDVTDAVVETRGMFTEETNEYNMLAKANENVGLLLSRNVTSIQQLQNITSEATSALDELSLKTHNTHLDIDSKIRPNISVYNVTVAGIETDIDNLHNSYSKEEKNKLILSHLPQLLLQYNSLNKSLSDTKQRLPIKDGKNNRVNETIVKLQKRIDSLQNIRISTDNATLQHASLKDNISELGDELNVTSGLFDNLDTSIFERTDWLNFSIGDIEKAFDTFMNNISLINATLTSTNNVMDDVDVAIKESLAELNHTNSVLDRYNDSVNASIANEYNLEQLSIKLSETDALLEDVKKRFYYDGDRLFNLTRQYPKITNSAIVKTLDETRSILEGTVGLRIPLANKLFTNRIMENYNVVSDRFDDVVYTLNENYTTKGELESILGDVEDTLNNVTLETEDMVSNEEFYREDALRLSQLLNESNSLLNKLEEMYKAQMKSDLLHANIPNLTKQWKMQNDRLKNITDDLNTTSIDISDLKLSMDNVDNTLNDIDTVTISTNDIRNNLTHAATKLKNINDSANYAKAELDKIRLFDIDVDVLERDEAVSVKDVQEQLAFMERSLHESEKYITGIENSVSEMKDNVTSTNDNLNLLNDTLSEFKNVEEKATVLEETLNNTTTNFNNISSELKAADAKMASYKESLSGLKQKYKNYEYDSNDVELLLRVTDEKMAVLNDTLSESQVNLSEAEAEYNDTSVKLYTVTDDISVLNESLKTVNSVIPVITSKVNGVSRALDDIRSSIPDLNIELQDLNDMLQLMNKTLVNEKLKSNFADNALPVLEEKYKLINRTFEMTNKTLQKMADEMEMLNNYIEALKQRMKDFDTINISVSDIDANITHLENRLVIMQDHYNHVKGIVNTFQKDVRVNNIFGRNISLSDVEDQYKTFNDTLDQINEVLAKIDNEAYEMEEHFEDLNDTMYKIDHALDRFETKQMNTKTMEKEIEIIGNDISDTNNSIIEMTNTVKGFNKTLEDMRVLYANVIDSTAENNTLVNELLTSMDKSLLDLHNLMVKLDEMHVQNTDDFGTMNETLFKNINTYADLNNTLDDVKNKLLTLSKSIHKLRRDVAAAKQNTLGRNSTLSDISELLDFLNNTLHKEQVKYDFIESNLGNLEEKFSNLKRPVEMANHTLSKVSEKVSNTSQFVKGVAEKLKDFSNINISLGNDMNKLIDMEKNISRIKNKLRDVGNTYEELQSNFTLLGDRSGDMNDIVGKYSVINETLDNLQDNLTDMLSALDGINLDTDLISNRTESLDSSLDKLNSLNTSSVSLTNRYADIEDKLDNTSATLMETESTTNDLKQNLLDMERLYSTLDDPVLLDKLLELMKKVNETSAAVKNVQSSHNGLIKKTNATVGILKETQTRLNSDIDKQKTLDEINKVSEDELERIQNETDLITTIQNSTENEINELHDTIASLTNEILRLNETLAEETRKKQFISDNFPEMKDRYNLLNSLLDGSSKSINDAVERVDNVANNLSNVKDRLENITAIAIPLDSESKEVLRIKDEVENVGTDFKNISKIYDGLNIQKLNNLSTDYDNLLDTYANFDQSMQEVEKTLNKMNNGLIDLNKTITVIDESVHDINATVDEYIETGEKIMDVLESGNIVSKKIKYTNETVTNLSDEVQTLADSLQVLLVNYSHIKDPEIVKTQALIKDLLKSSKDNIRTLENKINTLETDDKKSDVMMEKMNDTYMSTKLLLGELKQHIKDVRNTSSIVNDSIGNMEVKNKGINESAGAMTPELKNIFEKIGKLSETYIKEQEKLNLIASNKPIIEKRFKSLQKPLEETNKHISLTEVKLADLKYAIKTVGSRLDKFNTLNITTEPELEKWNNMSQTAKNMSKSFKELREKSEQLHKLVNTIEDRNMTIDEMKNKFRGLNVTLDNVEDELKNINKKLSDMEKEINNTENVLRGLRTSMDSFKSLQSGAAKIKQNINAMQNTVQNLENKTVSIANTGADVKDQLETMKNTYAVLNNTDWNKLLPKFKKDLSNHENNLKKVNKTMLNHQQKLNSTTKLFDAISSDISNKSLTRQEVDPAISTLQKRLNSTTGQLDDLDKRFNANDKTLTAIKKATDDTQKKVNKLNTTLHNELLKYNYVKQNLPQLKEKHLKVNTSFVGNIPNMENMQGQVANLVSIVQRIKEKMRQFGVPDTDNSLKKWDLAVQKLNATVATILKKNKEAGDKLDELRSVLWSNNTMYTSAESLSDIIARFDGYNKTLDEINAASHTINIKLADLGSAASGVIEQLMERDAVLTTTPATTTPSGPPDWLSFRSTVSGEIGKDPGVAECAAEDLNEWQMMKITRVNKDGKEEPIAAWKLGAGARKAVRDRRIRVRRSKTATGGKLTVGIQALQCEDEGTYYCSIDSYNMWPLESSIAVVSPPQDNVKPDFPTEVFEDKVANFSCTGHPGYPNGRLTWKIKRENEKEFQPFDFYSSKSMVADTSCVRTETNRVEYQFDLKWNNTKVRCYIENTDFYAEGIIQLLPYDICNRVRYLGTISHPYTPHKYIVCGKELNIMQCPGNTCYDEKEENCVRCKAGHAGGGDPCLGQPLYSYVPHETDCTKYYMCMGATKTSRKCAKGYFAPDIAGNCVMVYAQSHCGRKAG